MIRVLEMGEEVKLEYKPFNESADNHQVKKEGDPGAHAAPKRGRGRGGRGQP